jgi:hypothetical protein
MLKSKRPRTRKAARRPQSPTPEIWLMTPEGKRRWTPQPRGYTLETLPDTPYNRKMFQEEAAYDRMWKKLLKTHLGKFVAIHNGQLVDWDRDEDALRQVVLVTQMLKSRWRIEDIPGIDLD